VGAQAVLPGKIVAEVALDVVVAQEGIVHVEQKEHVMRLG
jgi:hypothetical protein